jgi:hypothetical protein
VSIVSRLVESVGLKIRAHLRFVAAPMRALPMFRFLGDALPRHAAIAICNHNVRFVFRG